MEELKKKFKAKCQMKKTEAREIRQKDGLKLDHKRINFDKNNENHKLMNNKSSKKSKSNFIDISDHSGKNSPTTKEYLTNSSGKQIDIPKLSNYFENKNKLKKFELFSKHLTNNNLDVIGEYLKNTPTLSELFLNDNHIKDNGLKYLTQNLMNPRCNLKKLSLAQNKITDEAKILSNALLLNISLEELNLSENLIKRNEMLYSLFEKKFFSTKIRFSRK